jgi:hypothetical protein
MRRSLTEEEQHKIAGAIVDHLEQSNWKIEHGPPRGPWAAPHVQVIAPVRGNLAIRRMVFRPLFHRHDYCSC